MNVDRLLEQFDRIIGAPDAMIRIRRFILDLAVRGRLVPQDARDEPASELLKRIAKEKARRDRKVRINRGPEALNANSETHDVPSGWAAAHLADLVSQFSMVEHINNTNCLMPERLFCALEIFLRPKPNGTIPICNSTTTSIANTAI